MLATLTKMVPLSALRPGKNPRGKTGSVQDLLTSFDHAPQLHPITVRRLPGPRDEYEIIAGHRRVEAAKKKGWSHVEARAKGAAVEAAASFACAAPARAARVPAPTTMANPPGR